MGVVYFQLGRNGNGVKYQLGTNSVYAGSGIRRIEGFCNERIIGRHRLLAPHKHCSRLFLLIATGGLLFLAPGFLRAWEGPANSSPASANLLPGKTLSTGEGCLAGGDIGQPSGLSLPAPTGPSDGVDGQAPGADQTSHPSVSASPPATDQTQRTDVNALTGMAVASLSNYTPLTLNERWKLYLKMTYASAGPYFSPLVNALALDQSSDTPRQWGDGFAGFGRRLASRAGNAVLQGSFQAPLAALLHEDVRYIPTSQRSIQRRALHAVLYSFLTYNDKGHPTLNIANLAAFYASTAVTTTWLPGIGNSARYTFTNASQQIALSFPLNVVQEFWPEIQRHLFRRH